MTVEGILRYLPRQFSGVKYRIQWLIDNNPNTTEREIALQVLREVNEAMRKLCR